MKMTKFMAGALCVAIITSSCSSMSNTAKGGLFGAGGGAALGAVIGALAGNAGVGAAIGTAVGTGAGVIIGKKMDKAKREAEAIKNAQVESIKDANGLDAVKLTFDSGLLFASGSATLSNASKASLDQLAALLNRNQDADVNIQGYTDNDGWRGATAAQSKQKNLELSQQRAAAVTAYLLSKGVSVQQIKATTGFGEDNPVASNATPEGKRQNRRVEVYLYASQAMIQAATHQAS
ncbi:MAG: OmpA family protein [Bacteroidales bacterium]|nr:OmpA family protein [Bacteroidales bacterium]